MSKWQDENVIKKLYELKDQEIPESFIAEILSKEFPYYSFTKDSVGNFYRRNKEKDLNENLDILNENTLTKVHLQKQKDINRIERNSWRNVSRLTSFLEEYNSELLTLFEKKNFNFSSIQHKINFEAPIGIIHLSDLHFNEVVEMATNKYDYIIASKRLKILAEKAKLYFKELGVSDILIAATGDFINSDRRLDEIISNATVRARAVFIASQILANFINDLHTEFNITFSGVTGNESRIKEEFSLHPLIASDNYDYTIYNLLSMIFKDTNIKFKLGNPVELICTVNKQNILLMHGTNLPNESVLQRKISEIYGKYSVKNISLRYIIFGHYHSAAIGDYYGRSSSLVGSNHYSDFALNYISRASQNLYLVFLDGSIDAIKVDLQNVENTSGYSLDTKFIENLRSSSLINIVEI
jgi:predicted phosphodiesterase